MLKIAVYHWLPIADNMLPEIRLELAKLPNVHFNNKELEGLSYSFDCEPADGGYRIEGRISPIGFVRHVHHVTLPTNFDYPSTGSLVSSRLPTIRDSVNNLLLRTLPQAVRNKLAVLREGLVSFPDFPNFRFASTIETPANDFLTSQHIAALEMDKEFASIIEVGLDLDGLDLHIASFQEQQTTSVNASADKKTVLFYSRDFDEAEEDDFDGTIFRLCSLEVYTRFLSRELEILKDARAFMIPLRRDLALALQRHTEEHFSLLTSMKRYLTYVHVKLPVLDKIRNHLTAAAGDDAFMEMKKTLSPDEVGKHSITRWIVEDLYRLSMIDGATAHIDWLDPSTTLRRIKEDTPRVEALYLEDQQEVAVISNEASQVLDGTLMRENVQLSSRRLDAAHAALELDRTAKNRANALKILSVVLSANTAVMLTETLLPVSTDRMVVGIVKLSVALAAIAVAWVFVDLYMRSQSSFFRIVVPISARLPLRSLDALIDPHRLRRQESNGPRRTRTWSQKLFISSDKRDHYALGRLLRWMLRAVSGVNAGADDTRTDSFLVRTPYGPEPVTEIRGVHSRPFLITIDYEKRGYVHSLTIEAEYDKELIQAFELVLQVLEQMHGVGCFEYGDTVEYSVAANIVETLELRLHRERFALTRILVTSQAELRSLLDLNIVDVQGVRIAFGPDGERRALSDDDLNFIAEVEDHVEWYLDRLGGSLPPRLKTLFGESNLGAKWEIVRHTKRTGVIA